VKRPDGKPLIDWSSVSISERGYAAHLATSLGFFSPREIVIRRAFEAHGLDPMDPYHWRELVYRLADASYGPLKSKKWDMIEVLNDLDAYPDAKSDLERAWLLKRDRDEKYGFMDDESLRKLIGRARRAAR
jgi:hypothetical protein